MDMTRLSSDPAQQTLISELLDSVPGLLGIVQQCCFGNFQHQCFYRQLVLTQDGKRFFDEIGLIELAQANIDRDAEIGTADIVMS